jgi:hypothetical protein
VAPERPLPADAVRAAAGVVVAGRSVWAAVAAAVAAVGVEAAVAAVEVADPSDTGES